MSTDPNGIRKPLLFSKNPVGPLLPVATNTTPNDVSALFSTPFTRDSTQKTRPEPLHFQATGQVVSGLGSTENNASPARSDRQVFPGFEGFARSRVGGAPVSLPQAPQQTPITPVFSLAGARPTQNASKTSDFLFATSTISRQDKPQTKPLQSLLPPAGFPFNTQNRLQNSQVQKKVATRPSSKAIVTRSSTPAHDLSRQEGEPSSVDFNVFQSLLESQKKKEDLLMEKEDLLLQANDQISALQKTNLELTAELGQTKEKSKAYIKQCDKLLRSVQKETATFQATSREAYTRCIDDIQANLPDLGVLKSELTERMQSIEFQLEEEHQHRARIGPDLLHQLENSQHNGDYLRDKLLLANGELVEAKQRVQELENLHQKENVALFQALKLLEDTNKELKTLRESSARSNRLLSEELETLIDEYSRSTATQISDLEKLNQTLKETVQSKQDELDRIKADMDVVKNQMKTLEGLPAELAKAKDVVVEKDSQIAAFGLQQATNEARIGELTEQVKKSESVATRLEDTLLRLATLESQHVVQLASCTEQKNHIRRLEEELALAQSQYSQAQQEVTNAENKYQLLDSKYEDLRACSHANKEELITLHTHLERAQKDTEKQQALAVEQLEKTTEERKRLENVLGQSTQALKKSQEDLAEANAEKKQLEAAVLKDVEKFKLRAQLVEYQKQASAEKIRLEGAVVSLEKDLQESLAITKELRGNLTAQKATMDETIQKINSLSEEKTKVTYELEASKAKYEELSASHAKLGTANDLEAQLHLQEKAAFEARVHEAEQNLNLSREELGKAQLHVQFLSSQVAELTRTAEERVSEINAANERWIQMEKKMDHLNTNLSDAKTSIHSAVELTSTLAAARETNVDTVALDLLKSQAVGLQEQLTMAVERNASLEEASRTLLDRHQRRELTEQESALVKLVASSTMQVHEKERIQGTNDLKRRDATIQALQRRIKELERQLASRLERKSPNGQLMKMTDILTSSPLSVIDEAGASPQHRTTAIPTKQFPVNRPSPLNQVSRARANPHNVVTSSHAVSFAKLNKASSGDVDDEDTIGQFSDKGLDEMVSAPDLEVASKARTMKRGRDDETLAPIGPTGGKAAGTRATRRRKLSTGAVAVAAEGDIENGIGQNSAQAGATAGEERSAGVAGEAGAGAAKYKAAQRGKLRR